MVNALASGGFMGLSSSMLAVLHLFSLSLYVCIASSSNAAKIKLLNCLN